MYGAVMPLYLSTQIQGFDRKPVFASPNRGSSRLDYWTAQSRICRCHNYHTERRRSKWAWRQGAHADSMAPGDSTADCRAGCSVIGAQHHGLEKHVVVIFAAHPTFGLRRRGRHLYYLSELLEPVGVSLLDLSKPAAPSGHWLTGERSPQ